MHPAEIVRWRRIREVVELRDAFRRPKRRFSDNDRRTPSARWIAGASPFG
ncbi:MAG: hypothetical protein AVDCRST_MAG22-2942 [uncultured Rubrobacteraceae bacterium]|uniref:Uncharacterized protein n=1 Tax=uncultured Rubrobacteraceae bacterium TaxID=349277 RepID=A0A6J4Q2K9_9ACTN|nr:MAG: hypothetical protein AVDCRST_MAG22-2942 [uncultured Rubrobacteraceae bacterium]